MLNSNVKKLLKGKVDIPEYRFAWTTKAQKEADDEFENMLLRSYAERRGVVRGKAEGKSEGLITGEVVGRAVGQARGERLGREAGITEGLARGQAVGFKTGISKGRHNVLRALGVPPSPLGADKRRRYIIIDEQNNVYNEFGTSSELAQYIDNKGYNAYSIGGVSDKKIANLVGDPNSGGGQRNIAKAIEDAFASEAKQNKGRHVVAVPLVSPEPEAIPVMLIRQNKT